MPRGFDNELSTDFEKLFVNNGLLSVITKTGSKALALPEYDTNRFLFSIVHSMRHFLSYRGAIYRVRNFVNRRSIIERSQLGLALENNIHFPGADAFLRIYPHHELNPHCNLFFELRDEINSIKDSFKSANATQEEYFIRVNELIDFFRKKSRSLGFRKTIDSFRKRPKENSDAISSFVKNCFKINHRLLLIRLDLYSHIRIGAANECGEVDIKTVKKQLKSFLDRLSLRIFKNRLVGYCWKLSHSLSKGFYYHLMIFVLPQGNSTDTEIDPEIGRLWIEGITEAQGGYWAYRSQTWTSKVYDAGLLDWKSSDTRDRLKKLSQEITASDYFVRLNYKISHRTLGISKPTDPRKSKKRKIKKTTSQGTQKRYFVDALSDLNTFKLPMSKIERKKVLK